MSEYGIEEARKDFDEVYEGLVDGGTGSPKKRLITGFERLHAENLELDEQVEQAYRDQQWAVGEKNKTIERLRTEVDTLRDWDCRNLRENQVCPLQAENERLSEIVATPSLYINVSVREYNALRDEVKRLRNELTKARFNARSNDGSS